MTPARSYRLAARDTTGLFLGLGPSELVMIGAGFAVAVLLRLAGLPLVVVAAPLVAATGGARLRIGGQRVYRWLPLLTGWIAGSATGRRLWRRSLPLLPGTTVGVHPLPPVLRGLDVVETTGTARTAPPWAAVRDRRSARLTAVMPVRGTGFVGADPSVQDALLAAWGDALSMQAASGGPVVQIGWSHQARTSALDAHRSWVDARAGANDQNTAARAGYFAAVDEIASLAAEHETVVWLTVSGHRIPGRGRLIDRAASHLPAAVDTLLAALDGAGVQVDAPLPAADLWRLLRRRSDLAPIGDTSTAIPLAERMGLVRGHNGVPLAMDTGWSELHLDDAWHRTYWVETWPRRPVPADWLAGFLGSGESTTMTVLYRPIEPGRSQRRIESQLVKLAAHRARKEDKARRISETDERAEEAVHELESELASGFAEVLYLGLISVTGASLEELDRRCQTAEQTARAAQMGLRVLHGRQDVAWAATLPFGLAEPGLVEVAGL